MIRYYSWINFYIVQWTFSIRPIVHRILITRLVIPTGILRNNHMINRTFRLIWKNRVYGLEIINRSLFKRTVIIEHWTSFRTLRRRILKFGIYLFFIASTCYLVKHELFFGKIEASCHCLWFFSKKYSRKFENNTSSEQTSVDYCSHGIYIDWCSFILLKIYRWKKNYSSL